MSWRAGAFLFLDIWPHVKMRIVDEGARERFTRDLLELFSRWEIDRLDLGGVDPDLDQLIGHPGPIAFDDDVDAHDIGDIHDPVDSEGAGVEAGAEEVDDNQSGDGEDDEIVLASIANLTGPDLAQRRFSADALASLVAYADGRHAQAAADALVLACDGEQASDFLIAALGSLRDLVRDHGAEVEAGALRTVTESSGDDVTQLGQSVLDALERRRGSPPK